MIGYKEYISYKKVKSTSLLGGIFIKNHNTDFKSLTKKARRCDYEKDTEIQNFRCSGSYNVGLGDGITLPNGRIFAGATHGAPHAPTSSDIQDNGMNGHVCLWFRGSTTGSGDASWVREMNAAIEESINAIPRR